MSSRPTIIPIDVRLRRIRSQNTRKVLAFVAAVFAAHFLPLLTIFFVAALFALCKWAWSALGGFEQRQRGR